MLKLARLKSLLSVTFNIFHMFQVGIYPQLNTCSDLTNDELIEDCSKCYLAGLPCADTVTTDTDQTFYSKYDADGNYLDGKCEGQESKFLTKKFKYSEEVQNIFNIFPFQDVEQKMDNSLVLVDSVLKKKLLCVIM